jgi:hypothetical protein
LKNPITKNWAGGVAQGEGPEFQPENHKKERKKRNEGSTSVRLRQKEEKEYRNPEEQWRQSCPPRQKAQSFTLQLLLSLIWGADALDDFLFLAVLGFELRASILLAKCSTT